MLPLDERATLSFERVRDCRVAEPAKQVNKCHKERGNKVVREELEGMGTDCDRRGDVDARFSFFPPKSDEKKPLLDSEDLLFFIRRGGES